jgi:hypothetical protein
MILTGGWGSSHGGLMRLVSMAVIGINSLLYHRSICLSFYCCLWKHTVRTRFLGWPQRRWILKPAILLHRAIRWMVTKVSEQYTATFRVQLSSAIPSLTRYSVTRDINKVTFELTPCGLCREVSWNSAAGSYSKSSSPIRELEGSLSRSQESVIRSYIKPDKSSLYSFCHYVKFYFSIIQIFTRRCQYSRRKINWK